MTWAPPQRTFATALTINAVGNGLYVTISTIYFTLYLGLSVPALSAMLSLSAVAGIVAGPVLGHLADRYGARVIYCRLLLVDGAVSALFAVVHSAVGVAVCLAIFVAAQAGTAAARGALIGALVSREQRVAFRSVLRALANVGVALGSGLAGLVLVSNDRRWFGLALVANAITFLVTAGLTWRLPAGDRAPATRRDAGRAEGRRRSTWSLGLRDRRYLAVVALNAVLCVHVGVLAVGVPLWLVHRTDAPTWCVSMLLLINTIGIAVFMGPVGRLIDSRRACRLATWVTTAALVTMCLLLAMTDGLGGTAVVTLLVLVGVAHLIGELLQAAAGWYLSFELAFDEVHGQYQGLFNSGRDVVDMVTPLLFALVVTLPGIAGWAGLAVVLLVAGLALPWATDRAWDNREIVRVGIVGDAS
jgi:MFS family permease